MRRVLIPNGSKFFVAGSFTSLRKYKIYLLVAVTPEIDSWQVFCPESANFLGMKIEDFFKRFPSLGTYLQMRRLEKKRLFTRKEIERLLGKKNIHLFPFIPEMTLYVHDEWVLLRRIGWVETRAWIAKLMRVYEALDKRLSGRRQSLYASKKVT